MPKVRNGRWFAAVLMLLSVSLWATRSVEAAELLMFESPGCSWCAQWRAEVGPGYPKSDEGKRAPLRMLPLAQASSSGVQLAAPVVMSPTFVLVDDGREVGRIVGYPGADFFWGLLSQMIAKLGRASETEMPLMRLSRNQS